jgi:hypothetical protein
MHFGVIGGLIGIGMVPPLNRVAMTVIGAFGPGDAVSYLFLTWLVATPILATLIYPKLPLNKRAGTEGLLLLFWWISIVVLILSALALGSAF